MLFGVWGQFLTHDIDLTPIQQPSGESAPISIPRCDAEFDKDCKGNVSIGFRRSVAQRKNGGREYRNSVTTWIDASTVYGSTSAQERAVRSFRNGKLKLGSDGLLPRNRVFEFVAGDTRANENVGLTAFHLIWLK